MAKRKSAASAHGENDQAKHHHSKRQRSSTTITAEAPSTPPIKTERPSPVTERKSVTTDQKFRNTLYDDIVVIKVGPAAAKFQIHRGVLSKSSSFFKDILKPGNVDIPADVQIAHEGDSTVVLLPKEDPQTFSRVKEWFYSKTFRNPDETWKSIDWQHLIDVYIFSVDKGIAKLHNTCIDSAILKVKDGGLFPGQDVINALWKPGVNATQFRKLFIKLFAAQCDLESAVLANRSYHQTFLNWLVIELYKMQSENCKPMISDIWKGRSEYWMYGLENPITVD